MMKRPKAHQIDDRAQPILRELLPISWVLNAQSKDYAKDFLVEVGSDDYEMTGDAFYIQLKGQEQPTFVMDGQFLSFSLETKHAKYYLDNVKDLPVFLVVVDVTSKKGYWLFLQEFLGELAGWRNRTSVVVRIPVQNELSNSAELRNEVTRAKKWLRLRHPGSINDAIAARAEQVRRRDDRFDMDTIEELYAVFIEDGLTKVLGSGADLEVNFAADACDLESLCRFTKPEAIRLTSLCARSLLGIDLDVGALTYEFTNMLADKSVLHRDNNTVTVSFQTTDVSMMRVWAEPDSQNCV